MRYIIYREAPDDVTDSGYKPYKITPPPVPRPKPKDEKKTLMKKLDY
jgi:hypothetical protein